MHTYHALISKLPVISFASVAPSAHVRALSIYLLVIPAGECYNQAIAKTCDELHVSWQKEYFGAW